MVAPQTLDEGLRKTVRKGEPHVSAHCALREAMSGHSAHLPLLIFLLLRLTPLGTLHKHKTDSCRGQACGPTLSKALTGNC